VADILVSDGDGETDKGTKTSLLARIRRNWLEALILAGLIVAVILPFLGGSPRRETQPQVVVTAPEGLPAYRVIVAADLDVAEMEVADGAFTDGAEVEGRYALQWLEPGAPVTETQVSDVQIAPSDSAGWHVIALPCTQASTLGGALRAGDVVTMVLTTRPDAGWTVQRGEFENVRILAIKSLEHTDSGAGSSLSALPVDSLVVVAIANQHLERLKPLVAISDVYFLLPLGR
jgi:Flp pilus assembly protein CpaB